MPKRTQFGLGAIVVLGAYALTCLWALHLVWTMHFPDDALAAPAFGLALPWSLVMALPIRMSATLANWVLAACMALNFAIFVIAVLSSRPTSSR